MLFKRIIPALIALAMSLSPLTGCGQGDAVELDAEAMAAELLESGAFTDLLSPVGPDVAETLYGYAGADVAESSVYCGTGATAEEIAIFKASDKSAADRLRGAAEKRVEAQIKAFENYVPAEVPKLQKADIRAAGLIVVMVVSADPSKTSAILDDYLK